MEHIFRLIYGISRKPIVSVFYIAWLPLHLSDRRHVEQMKWILESREVKGEKRDSGTPEYASGVQEEYGRRTGGAQKECRRSTGGVQEEYEGSIRGVRTPGVALFPP